MTAYEVPDNNVDWECPEGYTWGDPSIASPVATTAVVANAPRIQQTVPVKAEGTCVPCSRKKHGQTAPLAR
jgi:hypothetical protein